MELREQLIPLQGDFASQLFLPHQESGGMLDMLFLNVLDMLYLATSVTSHFVLPA